MLNLSNAPGAMQAINAAGYAVEQRDNNLFGVRISDGATGVDIDDIVSQIDLNYPTSTAADYVCKKIEALATVKRNSVVSAYSPGEMASWPIKRAEALAYIASGLSSDAPNLQSEAATRGITLTELVTKVINDANRFAGLEAAIAGTSGRHRDAVKALSTKEAMSTYDYTVGWPV